MIIAIDKSATRMEGTVILNQTTCWYFSWWRWWWTFPPLLGEWDCFPSPNPSLPDRWSCHQGHGSGCPHQRSPGTWSASGLSGSGENCPPENWNRTLRALHRKVLIATWARQHCRLPHRRCLHSCRPHSSHSGSSLGLRHCQRSPPPGTSSLPPGKEEYFLGPIKQAYKSIQAYKQEALTCKTYVLTTCL